MIKLNTLNEYKNFVLDFKDYSKDVTYPKALLLELDFCNLTTLYQLRHPSKDFYPTYGKCLLGNEIIYENGNLIIALRHHRPMTFYTGEQTPVPESKIFLYIEYLIEPGDWKIRDSSSECTSRHGIRGFVINRKPLGVANENFTIKDRFYEIKSIHNPEFVSFYYLINVGETYAEHIFWNKETEAEILSIKEDWNYLNYIANEWKEFINDNIIDAKART